ncbi:MAG TPA: M23 family metallopeptidase [Candidatus Kapabacteria bacterium]|nr:M23 family metallopeptidase [Candidatus Kapabacteria bacterium]
MKRSSGPSLKSILIGLIILVLAAIVLLISSGDRLSWSNAGSPDVVDVGDSNQITTTPDLDTALVLRDTTAPKPLEVDTLRRRSGLIIPVAGVRPEDLVDTYTAARSQGRSHNAIDIIAAKGTPVLAAVDGPVKRLFVSDKGGITLYQIGSPDSLTVYYYAHLERYAEGVTEGKWLKQGEVLGYVGDTGNATPGNYHLHFAVWKISDTKNFWTGDDQNPYILLRH